MIDFDPADFHRRLLPLSAFRMWENFFLHFLLPESMGHGIHKHWAASLLFADFTSQAANTRRNNSVLFLVQVMDSSCGEAFTGPKIRSYFFAGCWYEIQITSSWIFLFLRMEMSFDQFQNSMVPVFEYRLRAMKGTLRLIVCVVLQLCCTVFERLLWQPV